MQRELPVALFVDKLPNGVLCVNADGVILYCNRRAVSLLGADEGQVLGSRFESWFGRLSDSLAAELGKAGSRVKVPYQNGTLVLRMVTVASDPDLRFFIFEDITVYEQVSEALERVSEARADLQLILDASHDSILIASGSGVVLHASHSFEESYGVPFDELVGHSVEELEARRVFNPSVTRRVLTSGKRQVLVQETAEGKTVLVTGTPVFDENGQIRRVVSYSHDVTEVEELKSHIEEVEAQMRKVQIELEQLRIKELAVPGLVVESRAMQQVLQSLTQAAAHDVPVLLLGESGVGKSEFARYIHNNSPHSCGPYIEVNCGAIPESLIESELFGYDPGAFTGAARKGRVGLVELANEGTLFLDEMAELPPSMQVKLLKVIQDGEFRRIGGSAPITSHFRLVCATNRDVLQMVADGRFRQDLYYRINTVTLTIPTLRDRKDDIPRLALHFLDVINQKHNLHKSLGNQVLDELWNYSWPGNLRELKNVIERAAILGKGEELMAEDLPEYIVRRNPRPEAGRQSLPEMLDLLEASILREAKEHCRTTVEMARYLGVSQPTIVRKLQKHAL